MAVLHVALLAIACTFAVEAVILTWPKNTINPFIKMDLQIRFYLQYSDHKINGTKELQYEFNGQAKDGSKNDTSQLLISSADKTDNSDKIYFLFYYMGQNLTLDIEYHLLPLSHWTHAESNNVVATLRNLDLLVKKDTTESYFCQLPTNHTFTQEHSANSSQTFKLVMQISQARMQAFGLLNGDFGRANECDVDSQPTLGNYTLIDPHNVTCFRLSGRFDAVFHYDTKGKKAGTSRVVFPQGELIGDHCSSGPMLLTLSFYQSQFNISFNVSKTTEKDYHVYVSNLTLSHLMPAVFFPHAAEVQGVRHLNLHGESRMFRFPKGMYFRCLANETYKLSEEGTNHTADLHMSQFRYLAYDDYQIDGKNFEQCPDDIKINNVVPIAVGAALGALVIIVLIAYLIGRRRTHKGYESV